MKPGIALVLRSGIVLDVPTHLIPVLLQTEPEIHREHTKWAGMKGGAGRVVVIDPDVVARILSQWPELDEDGSPDSA